MEGETGVVGFQEKTKRVFTKKKVRWLEKKESEFFNGKKKISRGHKRVRSLGRTRESWEEKKLNHLHLNSSGMATTGTFTLDFLVFFVGFC